MEYRHETLVSYWMRQADCVGKRDQQPVEGHFGLGKTGGEFCRITRGDLDPMVLVGDPLTAADVAVRVGTLLSTV